MRRLLYISTARTVLPGKELETILRVSRRNNAAVGVTGLLVVGGRRFLQLLEGPEENVTSVYQRITRDPRHFAIVTLSDKVVAERVVAQWSMGFLAGNNGTDDRLSLPEIVAELTAGIDDPMLHAEFTGFAVRHAA